MLRQSLSVFFAAALVVQPALLLALPCCCQDMTAGEMAVGAACPMDHGPDEECPHAAAQAAEDSHHSSDHATASGAPMGPMGDDDCRLVCGASHEDVALHATPRGLVPSPAVDLPHDRLVSVSFGGDPAVLNLSSPPLSPPPRG